MWPFVGLSLLYAALKLCLVLIANRSLSGGEAGDGHAERAAEYGMNTLPRTYPSTISHPSITACTLQLILSVH